MLRVCESVCECVRECVGVCERVCARVISFSKFARSPPISVLRVYKGVCVSVRVRLCV